MTAQPSRLPAEIPEEDLLRADFYGLLSALLARPPEANLLARTAALTGGDTEIGRGVSALAELARKLSPAQIAREFNLLFIGLGRGELVPYASFYLTGFLNEKPLARLRDDMGRLGIAREEGVAEPEDSAASLCEMMAGLIRGSFGAAQPVSGQARFFETHLAPWIEHFFADLEAAKTSVFYAPVGRIGRAFIGVEREAFRMGT